MISPSIPCRTHCSLARNCPSGYGISRPGTAEHSPATNDHPPTSRMFNGAIMPSIRPVIAR